MTTLEQYLAPSPDLSFYKRKEEYEAESKDESIKLVSYDKCKDCEHYGVWSQRCWNVYECPKEVITKVRNNPYSDPEDDIPYWDPKVNYHKEVKIDAENESLSEAERKKILRNLYFIKCQCTYNDSHSMEYAYDAADEIERIIKH